MLFRSFAGLLLFALGCSSALLLQSPSAGAASAGEVIEGTLSLVDDDQGNTLHLVSAAGGEVHYLAIVRRGVLPGSASGPSIADETGSAAVSKKDLASVLILRVMPVALWDGDVLKCDDQPILCALPPPPPPPIQASQYELEYRLVRPGRAGQPDDY